MTTTAPPHPAAAAASTWHLAGGLVSLKRAVDTHWPHRVKTSDGGIGNAEHASRGSASDHNPWLNNTVRAYDFTAAGIDAQWFAEQLRLAGLRGDRRLVGGSGTDDNGYVIYNRHITSPDFSRWVEYDGPNPHTVEVHVSVTRDPAGYEDAGPWPFLDVAAVLPGPAHVTPAPAPAPAPAGYGPHPGNTAHAAPHPDADPAVDEPGFPDPGHDAAGAGEHFRAQVGNTGPTVAHLQRELNAVFPGYSALTVDGVYGRETAAVVEEVARRIVEAGGYAGMPEGDLNGLRGADGNTVGPRLARAFTHLGVMV